MEEEEPTHSSIVEERVELIVSQSNPTPTLRKAHFLKPILTSIKGLPPESLSLSSPSLPPTSYRTQKCPLHVNFSGWRYPTPKWKAWVRHMEPMHQSVWKQAGFYEAIMSSTCRIRRYDDLVIGFAEKWCPETNTFAFPWAEATVTLEDVMILGGYSVLGSPVFSCFAESRELKEIEDKLKKARIEIKAGQNLWMKRFMCSGDEIEHEAFLSFWLARFVFVDSVNLLKACIFPIAIHLARGTRMALAPAVLASIYRDLSLLKATITDLEELGKEDDGESTLAVSLWSPLQLFQLWVWERFPAFRPQPNVIRNGDPRSALWDKVTGLEVEDVPLALDSAGEKFCWRPYAVAVNGWQFPEFYREKEELENLGSNENILSFAFVLRVAELVGINCIEQYLPHRVAMQFGFDQDVPDHVARATETCDLAWISFISPIVDRKLYVPSRMSDCGVTIQYLEWWRDLRSYDALKNVLNSVVRKKRSFRKRPKQAPLALVGKKGDQKVCALLRNGDAGNSNDDVKLTANNILNAWDKQKCRASRPSSDHSADVPPGFLSPSDKQNCRASRPSSDHSVDVPPGFLSPSDKQKCRASRPSSDHSADVPSGFLSAWDKQKCRASRPSSDHSEDVPPGIPLIDNMRNENDATEDVKPKFIELLITFDKIQSHRNEPSNDSKHLADQAAPNTKATDGALLQLGSQEKTLESNMNVKAEIDWPAECSGDRCGSKDGVLAPETSKCRNHSLETQRLALEVEARIARLEKAVAQQKAERFGYKFRRNFTKEGRPAVSGL